MATMVAKWTEEQLAEVRRRMAEPKTAPSPADTTPGGILAAALARFGTVEREYRFHPARKWRFDIALPEVKIAVEIDGGVVRLKGGKRCSYCGETPQGRHNRTKGFLADIEKLNAAVMLGWRVLRCVPDEARRGTLIPNVAFLVAGMEVLTAEE